MHPTEDKLRLAEIRLNEDKACLAKMPPPELRRYTIKVEMRRHTNDGELKESLYATYDAT